MKLKPRLLFYWERETDFNDKIRSELFSRNLPFMEIDDADEFLDALSSHKFNVLMRLDSQELYNKVVKTINEEEVEPSSFMIIHENPTFSATTFNSTNDIQEITKYIVSLALSNTINLQPIQPSVVQKILSMEMEKIDISKSYIGFKYLLDLIVLCMQDRNNVVSMDIKFDKVALFNTISKDAIERDVRHMLNKCWKNSNMFRKSLLSVDKKLFTVNFKNLLNRTVRYFLSIL